MLGIAMRIAQRMGLHSEQDLAKCTALEAELRRRLWWSLVLFDSRIGEMSDYKAATLIPTWDCNVPLNVNDSDLRADMKEAPAVQGKSTEAMFVVVRGEIGEFLRNTNFMLDYSCPALKPIAKDIRHGREGSEAALLEEMIEDKYLKYCDPENPLHFMTIWMTRGFLAKCALLEHHSLYSSSSTIQTESQRDCAVAYAIRMLAVDKKIMASPLVKGFLWLIDFHFPFPAYIQILQDLRRRPVSEKAEEAWEVMSENFEARFVYLDRVESPFFKTFVRIVLQAWGAREAHYSRTGEPLVLPRIVSLIRHKMATRDQNIRAANTLQSDSLVGMGQDLEVLPMTMAVGSTGYNVLYGIEDLDVGIDAVTAGQVSSDVDANFIDWSAMDWGFEGITPYPRVWNPQL